MKNIIENIKLVGEFMGWKENKDMKVKLISGGITYYFQKNDEVCIPEAMCYHSSWDWLMEVVEKIESLNLGNTTIKTVFSEEDLYINSNVSFLIMHKECYVNFFGEMKVYENWISVTECNSKIEAVYNACVEFIKWYNSHLCSNCGRFDDVVGTHNIDTCEECALNS